MPSKKAIGESKFYYIVTDETTATGCLTINLLLGSEASFAQGVICPLPAPQPAHNYATKSAITQRVKTIVPCANRPDAVKLAGKSR